MFSASVHTPVMGCNNHKKYPIYTSLVFSTKLHLMICKLDMKATFLKHVLILEIIIVPLNFALCQIKSMLAEMQLLFKNQDKMIHYVTEVFCTAFYLLVNTTVT